MRTSDITIVFQGAFKPYITRDRDTFIQNIRTTRRNLPGAQIILSTWEGTDVPRNLAVDAVIFSKDPGGLAPLKLDDNKANNVNRQLLSTQAGLAAVDTKYAVKMRTDCSLEHAGFLDFHGEQLARDKGRERLIACSYFTLDPTVFERIPFHLSDWFHFGPTSMLQSYWSAPPMSADMARYYESHPHNPASSYFEKKFRTQFAAEQHLCIHYARSLGYTSPRFLNDVSEDVLRDFYRFLAQEVMLLDPWQIGVDFKKYGWVGGSLFQSMNNLMHLDWLDISGMLQSSEFNVKQLRNLIEDRARRKRIVRAGFRLTRSLHPFLFDPMGRGHKMRKAANRVLRLL